MTTTIIIYPKTRRPRWLKIGATVYCRGEAQDIFTVADLDPKTCSSMLTKANGNAHGRESWAKLTQALEQQVDTALACAVAAGDALRAALWEEVRWGARPAARDAIAAWDQAKRRGWKG